MAVPGPLAIAGLLTDAWVKRVLWKASGGAQGPREVDEMEVWEIAVLLGLANEVLTEKERHPETTPEQRLEEARERQRMRQRVRVEKARAEGTLPKGSIPGLPF